MSHIWNHVRHQEWPKDPGSDSKRFAGSSRGLFGRLIWRLQPVCYPYKMSHHHAKRYTVSQKNMWRKDLEISWPATQPWSFSGPPTYSQSKYIYLKSYLSAFSTKQKGESIESDSFPLNMMETTQEQVDIVALGPICTFGWKIQLKFIFWFIPLMLESEIVGAEQRNPHILVSFID